MAESNPQIGKARLQAILNRLLAGVTDDQLTALQTQIDQLEVRAEDGHHDHDHPTAV